MRFIGPHVMNNLGGEDWSRGLLGCDAV